MTEDEKIKYLKNIGDRVKQIREKEGMSQEELALKIGYKDRSAINKIEVGRTDPPQSRLKAISDALGVHIMEILNEPHDNEASLSDQLVKKYGEQVKNLLPIVAKLDNIDQVKLEGVALGMLSTEKYNGVVAEEPATYTNNPPAYCQR